MLRKPLTLYLSATTCLTTPALAQTASEILELPTVILQTSSYETEGSGSYTSDLVSIGEKEARSVREIPQSTTVITNDQIRTEGYGSLDQALTDTPGMLVLNNDAGRSSLFVRGFEMDYLYFNGLPAPLSSIYGTQPDMAIVDHVEVLKGPSGLFIGTGEPGGAVNMRLKQAQADYGGYGTVSLNSFGRGRLETDVTGALNESGTVRGRAVFAYEDGDGFVDGQENGVLVGYGTVATDIGEDTTLTFSLSHMERDIAPFNGLPTYADGTLLDVDPSTTTGADWNQFDNTVNDYLVELKHDLAGGGFLKFSSRYSDRDVDFLYAYAGSVAAADNTVSRVSWLARDYQEESLALDAFASLPFLIGNMSGNAIIGADYQTVTAQLKQARGTYTGTYDLDNWDSSAFAKPDVDYTASGSTQTKTDLTRYGVYSQLRLQPVDAMNVILGGRLTWYDLDTENSLTGATTAEVSEDGKFTPYAGFTYDVTPFATLYASYTSIFQPQTETASDGSALKPREGHQAEVGLKAELFDQVNAAIGYFDLTDKNRAVTDPITTETTAGEDVRARGVELQLSGEITEGWQVFGGYTFTETLYEEGNDATEGATFSTYTPDHMVQLRTNYTFGSGLLEGVSIGGGARWFSDFYAETSTGIEIRADSYTVVDLSAGYQINDTTSLRLRVNNVFDERYYSRVGGTTVFNFYGEPLNAELALNITF